MARTIDEIKSGMTESFMSNEDVASAYGFEMGASFSSVFSAVSVESLFFYIVAAATWVLETLFDTFKEDVEDTINEMVPHTLRWYRNKTLAFMKDTPLKEDSDEYDTSGMTESEIEEKQVVKYAATSEDLDEARLIIKVAGEDGGERTPLDNETVTSLYAYLNEIKDAGVYISLVNLPADSFSCTIEVYYDATMTVATVEDNVREAIESYIQNLPFNGEYSNMALIDAVQVVEGVKIAEVRSASSLSPLGGATVISVRHTPDAGYFTPQTITINMKSWQ